SLLEDSPACGDDFANPRHQGLRRSVLRMAAHQRRSSVERFHLANARLKLAARVAGEGELAWAHSAELDGTPYPAVTGARRRRVDQTAIGFGEGLELAAGTRQPLAIDLGAHADNLRRGLARQVEDFAEDVGDAMVAIEAGEHGERAAELDLLA